MEKLRSCYSQGKSVSIKLLSKLVVHFTWRQLLCRCSSSAFQQLGSQHQLRSQSRISQPTPPQGPAAPSPCCGSSPVHRFSPRKLRAHLIVGRAPQSEEPLAPPKPQPSTREQGRWQHHCDELPQTDVANREDIDWEHPLPALSYESHC